MQDYAEIIKTLPDWQIEEALIRKGFDSPVSYIRDAPHSWRDVIILAQAIGEPAMKPPVDPLEAEAREICARHYEMHGHNNTVVNYHNGTYKVGEDNELTIAFAALKRGVEIERSKQNK